MVLFKLIIRHGILARNSRGANLFLFMLLQFFALLFILKQSRLIVYMTMQLSTTFDLLSEMFYMLFIKDVVQLLGLTVSLS